MILLDANILLEILIPNRAHAEDILKWLEHNTSPLCISMLTVHLVLHFGLRDNIDTEIIQTFLADYSKEALLPEDYAVALHLLRDKDHEDALQLAVAERTDCTAIVTLDKSFASTYNDLMPFILIGA